jgi:hypothetical protein
MTTISNTLQSLYNWFCPDQAEQNQAKPEQPPAVHSPVPPSANNSCPPDNVDSSDDDSDDEVQMNDAPAQASPVSEVMQKAIPKDAPLVEHLLSLLDNLKYVKQRATNAVQKAEDVRQKRQLLTGVESRLYDVKENSGFYDFTADKEMCQLVENARNIGREHGIMLPQGTRLTKEQRDAMLSGFKRINNMLEDDLNKLVQEVKKANDLHDELFKLIKSFIDKHNEVIQKLLRAIANKSAG